MTSLFFLDSSHFSGKFFLPIVCALCATACVTPTIQFSNEVVSSKIITVITPKHIFDFDGLSFAPGSGLRWIETKNNIAHFWYVTDRGPNSEFNSKPLPYKYFEPKVFHLPDFKPAYGILELDIEHLEAKITSKFNIKRNGLIYSGLPEKSNNDKILVETALDKNGKVIPPTEFGLDPESIDFDTDGFLYIGDEYAPSINKINAKTGEIESRLTPGNGIPEIYSMRQLNRGFEALAIQKNGDIWAALQSAIPVPNSSPKAFEPFIRLLRLDSKLNYPVEFALSIPENLFEKKSSAKIGDMCFVSSDILAVILQGNKSKSEFVSSIVFYNLSNSIPILPSQCS